MRIGEVDPGLDLPHGSLDQIHRVLPMTALVRRRLLQRSERFLERGESVLHVALIGGSRDRGERKRDRRGRGGDRGGLGHLATR